MRMRLESLFHLSFYVTLALAGACLTLPSTFFLGWMPFFLAGFVVLGYQAWRHEGGWTLSESAANHLGVFIAIGAAGWILFQVPRSEEELISGGVNWPAGLLPHLGPLLMILLIVKLYRPKRLPDFWVIQTMGLMMVTLAAVLADDQAFGMLLLAYLTSLIWCLILYYPVRERAPGGCRQRREPGPAVSHDAVALPTAAPRSALGLAVGGTLGGGGRRARISAVPGGAAARAVAMERPATERHLAVAFQDERAGEHRSQPRWPGRIVRRSGLHGGRPRRRRQGAQRLADSAPCAETLEVYANGRWFPFPKTKELLLRRLPAPLPVPARPEPEVLAKGERLIMFEVKPVVAGGLVLAEPVNVDFGIGLAPRIEGKDQENSLFAVLEGCDTLVATTPGRRRLHTYSQLVRLPSDDVWQPAPNIAEEYLALLANQQPPRALAPWTRELLESLSGLHEEDRTLVNRHLPVTVHAKVAQALCRHLALSGEYKYTLELRRKDRELDPVVDFLINVKEGHCERYAGGLALMLRALGIRCRVVKGYQGLEFNDDGDGLVRLSQAHSWVQALVPGKESGTWQWLTLDPTPSTLAQEGVFGSWMQWCADNLLDTRALWRNLIMEYTPEQQASILRGLGRALLTPQGFVLLLVLGGVWTALVFARPVRLRIVGLVASWLGRLRRPHDRRVRFFEDFVGLCRKYAGLASEAGQTPREFAAAAALRFRSHAATQELADLPGRVVESYYRVRFGDQALGAEEAAEITRQLQTLRQRLVQVRA